MTSVGGSWRVASRLARREVRRHPWRHLLVIGMIFVPVLGALAAFSAITTYQEVNRHRDGFTFGGDNVVMVTSEQLATHGKPDGDLRRPGATGALGIPEGTRTEVTWAGVDWLHGDRSRPGGGGPLLAGAEIVDVPAGSAASAQFAVHEGRLPRAADEILLSRRLARSGGWSIGDTVTSARSDRTFRVVGIGDLGADTERRAAAVVDLPDAYWTQPLLGIDGIDTGDQYSSGVVGSQVLRAWVPDPAVRTQLDISGDGSRAIGGQVDRRTGPLMALAAAAICAVVAVVASAAFAIASRRQLRTVGLLSTVGTDPVTIRRSLVLQGAIPGAIAGLGAVLVALVATTAANAAGVPERMTAVSGARAALSPGGSVVVVLLGLASGIAAAWQPARSASRIPTLAALAGRRPVGPVRSRVPLGGAALWVGGAAAVAIGFGARRSGRLEQLQPFLVVGGVAALALGAVGLAPAAVALLDPLARRVRGTWRMGLRGLARNRMQSAATVAAIGVVLALPVGLLTARNGLDDRVVPETSPCCPVASTTVTSVARPRQDVLRNPERGTRVAIAGALRSEGAAEAADEVVEVLGPTSAVLRSLPLVDGDGTWRNVAVIDEDVAADVLEPWAAEEIRAGRAIAFEGDARQVRFTAAGDTAAFDVAERRPTEPGGFLPVTATYLVGAEALGDVGAERPPDGIVVLRATPLDRAERAAIRSLSGYERFNSSGVPATPTLDEVRDAVRAGAGGAPGRGAISISITGGEPAGPMPSYETDRTPRDEWRTTLLFGALASLVLALLVLTITLSLRSVDGEPDRRAALAAGVAPSALRRQRAFEGMVLAMLGALIALPLGWITVSAARFGSRDEAQVGELLSLPGWQAIPILLAPAVAAAVLWTVVPAIAAAVRLARGRDARDELVPRW